MNTLFLLGLFSFLLALALTPLVRALALRLGLVDKPDPRKIHKGLMPRVGGIAIFAAYLGAYALLWAGSAERPTFWTEQSALLWQLLPSAALMFGVGLLDDIYHLRPWQKLAGQFVAVNWAYWMGLRVATIGPWDTQGWLAWPLTVFWLLACTNAINLIDGVDGLAAGVGLCATLTTMLAALIQGNLDLALATVPLAGCLLGFLRYNFNPASIFLGDCGSLTIGFLLGCYGALWSQKSATLLGLVAPLMAMALPLLDVALSIARRYLRGQPIFGADRGHIHHRLLARGWSHKMVALALYAVCGVAALLSLLQSLLYRHVGGAIIVLFCVAVWFGVRHLGYLEFGVLRKMVVAGAFRRQVRDTIHLEHLQEGLRRAATPEECWTLVRDTCRDLGFLRVRLEREGQVFDACWEEYPADMPLLIQVTLPDNAQLSLHGDWSAKPSTLVLPLMTEVQRAFRDRATSLGMATKLAASQGD